LFDSISGAPRRSCAGAAVRSLVSAFDLELQPGTAHDGPQKLRRELWNADPLPPSEANDRSAFATVLTHHALSVGQALTLLLTQSARARRESLACHIRLRMKRRQRRKVSGESFVTLHYILPAR
jgi:hypothetical protein